MHLNTTLERYLEESTKVGGCASGRSETVHEHRARRGKADGRTCCDKVGPKGGASGVMIHGEANHPGLQVVT